MSVLITGESGTGKDLLARALHYLSPRRGGPFVPVNCAAIPESLIESELFGHARGAFTDAKQSKLGLFVAASHGTLFLDEIGEMLPTVQAKLLRVIEDKRVRPLGATGRNHGRRAGDRGDQCRSGESGCRWPLPLGSVLSNRDA